MGAFDQGPSHIPWTIRKSKLSFQTTVTILALSTEYSKSFDWMFFLHGRILKFRTGAWNGNHKLKNWKKVEHNTP